MKHLSELKLHNLGKTEMSKKEQAMLKGGCWFCSCGCKYSGSSGGGNSYYGGSSTNSNDSANDGGSWY